MSQDSAEINLEAALAQATSAARAVLRRKLNVTLRPEDGRTENQDALELLCDIQFRILRKLQSPDRAATGADAPAIRNIGFYAKQSARNACAEYLRDRYPHRAFLKNRLRRFFRSRPAFAEWELDGEMVCGFAGWRNRKEYAPNAKFIAKALADPASLAPDAQPRTSHENLHATEWDVLLESVLSDLGCAIELDDLVSVLAPRMGVKDLPAQTGRPAEDELAPLDAADSLAQLQQIADPAAEVYLRELLTALWQSLLQMDARKRCAFLLNPPSIEVELLPLHGVAQIPDIGKALALTDAQFTALWSELPLTEVAIASANKQANYDTKFAILWNFLPLQDALIGKLLSLNQQQVINQRMLARRILARELARLLQRPTK
ncbi:MAG TPA: hypothetical protein VKR82_00280 [Candidatus Acidoferrales bacterium]|nr:hypothetical protein [Candidatus Acidoferrales bacterium]